MQVSHETMNKMSVSASLDNSYDVILHIGAPKAGSSAIQRFCLTHRADMERMGFFYPEHTLDRNGVSGGHTQISGNLVNGDIEEAARIFESCLFEARRRGLCLLLSAEGFFDKHSDLKKITRGLKVGVVAFLREPVETLLSSHNQVIKRHMNTERLGGYIAKALPLSSLTGKPLLMWGNLYGDCNCIFIPYIKPSAGDVSIELTFLRVLGIPEEQARELAPSAVVIVNRSYVGAALELMRIINTVLPDLPATVAEDVDCALQGYSDRATDERGLGVADIPDEIRHEVIERLHTELMPVVDRFPKLQPLVRELEAGERSVGRLSERFQNLANPLRAIEENCPDALRAITMKAVEMRDRGRRGYSFCKLMDTLGIEFSEDIYQQSLLPPSTSTVLENERSEDADYLREMALILENSGSVDDALLFIRKALEKRPDGPVIRAIEERLVRQKRTS